MALDPNIILQARPAEIQDPLSQYAKLATLQGIQGNQRLQDFQLKAAQRDEAENEALKDIYASVQPDAQGAYDLKSLAPKVLGASPTKGAAVLKSLGELNTQQITQQKAQIENSLQKFELGSRLMSGVTDQATYDQAKMAAQQNGLDVSQWAPNYDPNAIKLNQMRALSIKDQLEQRHQELTLAETQRHNTSSEANQAGTLAIAKRTADRADSQAMITNAQRDRELDIREKTAKATVDPQAQKIDDEKEVNRLLDVIDPLIDQSTNSGAGAAVDKGMAFFGGSTAGADAAAQLKALQGALVSKMPKMSGPQSDKDVQLYREMAGQIGDPNIPASQKKAAIQTIRAINSRYKTGTTAAAPPAGGYSIGQIIEQGGKRYKVIGGDLTKDPDVELVP